METVSLDVNYYRDERPLSQPGGTRRVWSHKYSETWNKIEMYCPHCGKQEVWQEDSDGDYYVGEGFICAACEHTWTIQGPKRIHHTWEQDRQRLEAIRAAVSAPESPPKA